MMPSTMTISSRVKPARRRKLGDGLVSFMESDEFCVWRQPFRDENAMRFKSCRKILRKIFKRHGEFLASGPGFPHPLCLFPIMNKVLIIGAGGVGSVVAHKCAMVPEVFGEITLASRTLSKCDAIAAEVKQRTGRDIATAKVDADNAEETAALIRKTGAKLLINVALPYQDLNLMDACLLAGCDYMDTANYEPKDVAKFEYSWQWAYQETFRKSRPLRAARLRLRPRRDQCFHRLGAQAPFRRDPHARHHRRERRQPRQGLRHQFQPGNQHPRGHRRVPPFRKRRVRRNPADVACTRRSPARTASAPTKSTGCITRSWNRW